jgi:hypothetical protein
MDSLAIARAEVQAVLRSGEMIPCPCCAQTVKMYKRRVYGHMARCLKIIAKADGLTSKEVAKRSSAWGGDFAKLTYWQLIKSGEDGKWRATQRGLDFLAGRARIAKYANIFNGTVQHFSHETVNIRDIADEFNLPEILQ